MSLEAIADVPPGSFPIIRDLTKLGAVVAETNSSQGAEYVTIMVTMPLDKAKASSCRQLIDAWRAQHSG